MMLDNLDRREFLGRTVATGVLATTGSMISHGQIEAGEKTQSSATPKVGAFTKSFQDRPIAEVCRIFKKIGLDGLDLTVRLGGHIDPKNVEKELPKAVAAAKEAGVEILFLTTSITDADDEAARLLATAGELGIDKIKMGYHRYTEFGKLTKEIAEVRKRVASVAKLAEKSGVLPCIHIHSGKFIPSHGTMLYELIRDFSPQEVGAYVDPLHMTLEGASDGWRQGLDLLGPWISMCSVKNFIFEKEDRDKQGQQHWHSRLVPVADGICPIPEFVATLKTLNFHGPYSLHSEYKGRHSFKDMSTDECIAQTAEDFKFFKPLVSGS